MSIILNAINYFWKLGFNEETNDIYLKKYSDFQSISLNTANETFDYGDNIQVTGKRFIKFSQKNFIILEAVDRFLRKGYRPENIHLGKDSMSDFAIMKDKNTVFMSIRCMEWEEEYEAELSRLKKDPSTIMSYFEKNRDTEYFCVYTSRLKAGTIECKYVVFSWDFNPDNEQMYLGGLFEDESCVFNPNFDAYIYQEIIKKLNSKGEGNFEIVDGILTKYNGASRNVVIPEGVEKLKNSVFWNCNTMEKVTIPDSVSNLGGDTFYNCEHLSELTIPESVMIMGDNPFANCPKLTLVNKSPHFVLKDGALYDKDIKRLIYCAINRESDVFEIPDGVISISKHSFYNCLNLKKIVIPPSVKIIENNPFSNLPNLRIENNCPHFIFKDGALYNKTMTTLFYFEHGSGTSDLVIPEGVVIIGRHSFYNCQTIKTITIPSSVKIIGYNPFTNSSLISLINNSPEYLYENGALYNKDRTELIFYSKENPAKGFVVPDGVKKIGRSAFFGCRAIEKVVLPESVTSIERSAFANCCNLVNVSIPKSMVSLGEWAFVNCTNLKQIMVPVQTTIERHTFLNCPAEIVRNK